jgi:hypothetical protein
MDGLCYLIEDVDSKQHLDYLADRKLDGWIRTMVLLALPIHSS